MIEILNPVLLPNIEMTLNLELENWQIELFSLLLDFLFLSHKSFMSIQKFHKALNKIHIAAWLLFVSDSYINKLGKSISCDFNVG